MILVRPASTRDWHAVGTLVQESIFEAPSSLYGFEDLPADPLKLGQQLIRSGDSTIAASFVAETHLGLAGLCQVLYGEFQRCSHAGLLTLLVHPAGRNQGVGRELLREIETRFRDDPTIGKVTVQVAERDLELMHLVKSEGWRLERVCPNALDIGRHKVALHHYALDLESEGA
tara:strand:+ start:690 stop:1208 length:519 start_codon:yes stop_codon:yes gene_type:complete